jgi:hypothetical protein
MAEHAEVTRAEGLQTQCRGLGHVARCLDLVIQYDEDAQAARIGTCGDADGVHQIEPGIRG